MPHLPESSDNKTFSGATSLRRFLRDRRRQASKAILKSHRLHVLRGRDLPIRIRPWFLVLTCLTIILLGLLGFTNIARSLPLNDKILHFICLGIATGLFYWCFEPEEEARRVWFWRHAGLICTFILCFFFGAIMSEYVQSLLPYKTFEGGDILANLLGCSFGLAISWHLERYYRKRREIARLYTPLNDSPDDSFDEDELSELPTYRQSTGSSFGRLPFAPATPSNNPINGKRAPPKSSSLRRLGDVWDSGEELFAVGEEDESGEEDAESGRRPATPLPMPQL